jgi:outer membrane protein
MKSVIVSSLCMMAFAALPAADLKIGVVDMVKAVNEFYKTKEVNSKLQDIFATIQEGVKEREAKRNQIMEELQKLDKQARDPVLNEAARGKKQAELQARVPEAKAAEREIEEYRVHKKSQFDQEQLENRRAIFEEISKVIQEKSKAAGFDFVMDKTGVTMSGVPLFLYMKEGATPDITAEVIVELNKNAPPASAATVLKAEPVKAEEVKSPAKKSK